MEFPWAQGEQKRATVPRPASFLSPPRQAQAERPQSAFVESIVHGSPPARNAPPAHVRGPLHAPSSGWPRLRRQSAALRARSRAVSTPSSAHPASLGPAANEYSNGNPYAALLE